MRVLHAPVNIAGQPYELAKALRRKGVAAEMVVFKERPFVRGYDRSLNLNRYRNRILKWLVVAQAFIQAIPRYDIFHYHAGMTSLYPFRWDLPILRALGKKVVFQSWGSDTRGKSREELAYLDYADAVVVGSYHMLDFVPQDAHVVLPGLDLRAWARPEFREPSSQHSAHAVRVAHAPSSRKIKGTAYVLEGVAQLQARGVPVELVLVEGVPNAEAIRIYETCDIAIDQFGGWYGVFAIEAMALGKVVVGKIDPAKADRLEKARGVRPPIVSATPETLVETLEKLAEDPGLRQRVSRASRDYVEQFHDIEQSAREMLAIYSRL